MSDDDVIITKKKKDAPKPYPILIREAMEGCKSEYVKAMLKDYVDGLENMVSLRQRNREDINKNLKSKVSEFRNSSHFTRSLPVVGLQNEIIEKYEVNEELWLRELVKHNNILLDILGYIDDKDVIEHVQVQNKDEVNKKDELLRPKRMKETAQKAALLISEYLKMRKASDFRAARNVKKDIARLDPGNIELVKSVFKEQTGDELFG